MEKFVVIGLMTFLLIASVVYSQTDPQQSLKSALEQIARFFPNDIVHVQISLNDGTQKSFSATTSNGQVTDFKEGVPANPTLAISTSQSVLEKIYSSGDQASATIKELNSGGITITPVGIVNQIKLFFFKIFTTISGFFVKG